MTREALTRLAVTAALLSVLGGVLPSAAEVVGTGLTGFQEVPVISTTGSGAFFARINGVTSIDFVLVYEDLQGGAVSQAHIHIGQVGVNGAIMIHLCGSGGKPPCPPSPSAVTGVLTAADVVAVSAQGVGEGDLGAAIRAIRQGEAYANVHTGSFPAGEVRGQIR
jgi:CHRD domain